MHRRHANCLTVCAALALAAAIGCRAGQRAPWDALSWSRDGAREPLAAAPAAAPREALAPCRYESDVAAPAGPAASPQPGEREHRLAVSCDLRGDLAQAAQWYQKALRLRPGDPELLCDYGYHHYLAGRHDAAEAALRQAIARRPGMPRGHNNLGLVLAHRGRAGEALEHFQRAGCNEAEGRLNLAYALMWGRRWSEAHEQIQLAMRLEPASPAAQSALAALALAQGSERPKT